MSLATAPKDTGPTRSLKDGALAGMSEGMFVTLVMLVWRYALSTISLPDVLAEW